MQHDCSVSKIYHILSYVTSFHDTFSLRISCYTWNFSNKLKRDNFREKERNQIADTLNCNFKGVFMMKDTGKTSCTLLPDMLY